MDGEEVVQGVFDGLGGLNNALSSNSVLIGLALIACAIYFFKHARTGIRDKTEIDREVRRQMSELDRNLEERGYGKEYFAGAGQNIKKAKVNEESEDEDGEYADAEEPQMQHSTREPNSRIRTRVSSRHRSGNFQ